MKLGNYCTIVRGSSPRPQGDPRYFGGNVPRLMIADVTRDGMTVYPKIDSLTEEGALKSRLMKKGDFIIAVSGDPGRPCILGIDACIHDGFVGLRSLDNSKIFKPFLYYFFLKIKESNKKNAVGAIFKNFTADQIRSIEIPAIPLSDQIKIAQILTQAEKLIARRKESIALLDEYLKSTFLEMFGDPARNEKGWETKTIRSLSIRFSDGPFGSNLKTEHYSDKGIQVIRLQNIGINQFDERDISFINEEHFESALKKYSCFPGDVLIATMGSPNIRACILPNHVNVAVNKADCVLFRVNHKLTNQFFISHLLNQKGFLSLAKAFIHGQTRSRISSGQIAQILVPVPPLPLQTQFAQIVEKTEALKSRYEHSLRELEQLFSSLSQRAFKGELDLSRMEVSEEAYKISDTPPSPTPLKPEKEKKERPPVVVKEDTATSIWLSNRKKGKTGKVPFTPVEGNAVLRTEFAKQDAGFHFQAFEAFLKKEGFAYEFEQVKDFLFEKLEQRELLQYCSTQQWMEERSRPEAGPEQDDFSGDGHIWLVVNNKVVL